MKSSIILSSLASAIIATPLIAQPETGLAANAACPKITVVSATVTGDNCPTIGDDNFSYDSKDKNKVTITFGQFTAETDNGASGARIARKCTASIELAYPLPLPAGCSNRATVTAFERGYFQASRNGDYMSLDTDVRFSGGALDYYGTSSLPRSFTHHRQTLYAPTSDFYNDRRSGDFTFASPSTSRPGSSQGRQIIGTLEFDLTLQLFARDKAQTTLDYLDVLIETK